MAATAKYRPLLLRRVMPGQEATRCVLFYSPATLDVTHPPGSLMNISFFTAIRSNKVGRLRGVLGEFREFGFVGEQGRRTAGVNEQQVGVA